MLQNKVLEEPIMNTDDEVEESIGDRSFDKQHKWYHLDDGRVNWEGILTLIGGFFLMVYLGCFFLWASISIYVLSYFHQHDPSSSYDFIFLVDSALVLFNCIGYQIGAYLFQKRRWHPKLLLGLASGTSLVGVYLSSLCVSAGPYLACYCILNGLGCGTCYMIPLICGWEYFPNNRGLVTGITLTGYGGGSFIFAQVATKLVNPDNLHTDPNLTDGNIDFFGPEVADRVPYMIQTLVYIWIGLVVFSVALMSRKPQDQVEDETSAEAERVAVADEEADDDNYTDNNSQSDIKKRIQTVSENNPTELGYPV